MKAANRYIDGRYNECRYMEDCMTEKDILKHLPLSEATFYILLTLLGPLHGYAVMQKVEALTGGTVSIGPGTLYGAFTTLEKDEKTGGVDTTSYKNVWVFIEHERGKVANVSFELLGQGRKLADDLGCELCGMLLTDREGSDGYIQDGDLLGFHIEIFAPS
jgi:hypothetical protein